MTLTRLHIAMNGAMKREARYRIDRRCRVRNGLVMRRTIKCNASTQLMDMDNINQLA